MPKKDVFDGISFAPVLQGKQGAREFAFSFIRGERIIRTSEWLLEENHESNFGTLYFCGDKRGGIEQYENMTDMDNAETRKIRAELAEILEKYPSPKGLPYKMNQYKPGLQPILLGTGK